MSLSASQGASTASLPMVKGLMMDSLGTGAPPQRRALLAAFWRAVEVRKTQPDIDAGPQHEQ